MRIRDIDDKVESVDVFISYKETDNEGLDDVGRTHDSHYASDLYYGLKKSKIKTFYAPITLNKEAGKLFEERIYHAIHSSRIMVVLGTKPQYFESRWVMNEWKSFLSLIGEGKNLLIPVYWKMKHDELPNELKGFQSYDTNDHEWMQNLIRRIKDEVKKKDYRIKSIELRYIFDLIQKKKFDDARTALEGADGFIERKPSNALAYIGLLLCDLKIEARDKLINLEESFDDNDNYKKALDCTYQTNDKALRNELECYLRSIKKRKEEKENRKKYDQASDLQKAAKSEKDLINAALIFESLQNFNDSDHRSKECRNQAEEFRKKEQYNFAVTQMNFHTIDGYSSAIKIFEEISSYEDSINMIFDCNKSIEKLKENRYKKIIFALSGAITIIIVIFIVVSFSLSNRLHEQDIIDNGNKKTIIELTDNLSENEKQLMEVSEELNEIINRQVDLETNGLEIAEVGDRVYFGSYEQDGDIQTENELIRWIVLDKIDSKLLLISEHVLDAQPYHVDGNYVNWDNSSLREWLINVFFEQAFSESEKRFIVSNEAEDPTIFHLNESRVFLLSSDEANKYFKNNDDRKCGISAFARKQADLVGVQDKEIYDQDYHCGWWIIVSKEEIPGYERIVNSNGETDFHDRCEKINGVRPCIWVDSKHILQE